MEKYNKEVEEEELQDFSTDTKREIAEIINDCPSLVRLGEKEYAVKNLRYYSLNRIHRLALEMKKADDALDTDQKFIGALCTDLDAMCEIMAIILCNHRFTPDDIHAYEDIEEVMSRNDKMVATMKAKVMLSTYEDGQWSAIILAAIKSCDLTTFFLNKKLVSMASDSMLMRKKKSTEIVSLFTEALSLQTPATSSAPSHNTP